MYLLQAGAGQSILPQIVGFGGIIVVLLGIIFLIFFIFSRHRHNQLVLRQKAMQEEFNNQLIQSHLEVQEYTLSQLSQELHDNVGQLLSTTRMLLAVTTRTLQIAPDSLSVAEETLSKAMVDLRALAKSFSPEWLHQFNLVENLESEAARINAARQISVSLKSNIRVFPLEPREQVMLFRIIQEALQNCLKHARPTQIMLGIESTDNLVRLEIVDNGQGFDTETFPHEGIGIINMRQRVKLLGGSIEWQSRQESGTKVLINLPVQPI